MYTLSQSFVELYLKITQKLCCYDHVIFHFLYIPGLVWTGCPLVALKGASLLQNECCCCDYFVFILQRWQRYTKGRIPYSTFV